MNKKKIVVFIDWFYPGFRAGGPVRSCMNFIDHLKSEFDFYVVTRDTDYCESVPYENVKSDEWNKLSDGLYVFYFSKKKLNYNNLRKMISQHEDAYKYYLNGIFSYHFTLFPLLSLRNKKAVIIAPRGMFAGSALAIKPVKKKLYIFFMKLLGLYKKVRFQATSPGEQSDIRKELGNDVQIIYAPNFPRKFENKITEKNKKKGELYLFYLARISPEKNLLFALEVLKQLSGKIIYDIYGVIYDQDYWNRCQELIKTLPSNIIVNYKGVAGSEATIELINRYHFLFLPTRGENYGHSIVESLGLGCPVIISDQTPWKNIASSGAGWDGPLSNISFFINIIEECLNANQEIYDKLSFSAVEYFKNNVNNQELLDKNKKLFE